MTPIAVTAYPLQWPRAVPRTTKVADSRFGKIDWTRALKELRGELGRLGATYVTISTNQKLRNDGLPYAVQGRIEDAGVAVYFVLDEQQVCFPCDAWTKMADNVRAITKHIEAMRGQQRWGVGTAKQAFAGYKALAATSGHEDWWLVLEIDRNASVEEIKAKHKELAKKAHPDAGGSEGEAARVNLARDRALRELGGFSENEPSMRLL